MMISLGAEGASVPEMDEIDSSMGMLANEVPMRNAALGRNGNGTNCGTKIYAPSVCHPAHPCYPGCWETCDDVPTAPYCTTAETKQFWNKSTILSARACPGPICGEEEMCCTFHNGVCCDEEPAACCPSGTRCGKPGDDTCYRTF